MKERKGMEVVAVATLAGALLWAGAGILGRYNGRHCADRGRNGCSNRFHAYRAWSGLRIA